MNTERFDTVVIGGGQAGLAVGYYLAKSEQDISRGSMHRFVILDAHDRIGDSWRKRWDSLHLFTPASFNSLPGMPFPATRERFPGKDEMADYLEAYAARFRLPVQLGVTVDELVREDGLYLIRSGARWLEAKQVVVATGAYATPRVPEFAARLDPAIAQLHSLEYRNPGQLRDDPVLVVGAGNSGAEIALDLAPGHSVWLAGRETGYVPGDLESYGFRVGTVAFQMVMNLLTADTLPGRWVIRNARAFTGGHPLVRIRPHDLIEAGVQRAPRVTGIRGGQPELEDGRVLDVANVVWSTGFVRDFRWIKLPIFDAGGDPIHHRGVVRAMPGLYFTGLPFQSSLLSGLVAGTGTDAKYVVRQIARRVRTAGPAYEGKRKQWLSWRASITSYAANPRKELGNDR